MGIDHCRLNLMRHQNHDRNHSEFITWPTFTITIYYVPYITQLWSCGSIFHEHFARCGNATRTPYTLDFHFETVLKELVGILSVVISNVWNITMINSQSSSNKMIPGFHSFLRLPEGIPYDHWLCTILSLLAECKTAILCYCWNLILFPPKPRFELPNISVRKL